ncbi:MAG: hypothetical protein IT373_01760, partial [Polyangiaceae bacterium]|nr:hypothetical protein [Polyangiaceae bacterium]
MARTDVGSSVEAFAALCAELDDPFAARDGVLRARGLDARGFASLRAAWL